MCSSGVGDPRNATTIGGEFTYGIVSKLGLPCNSVKEARFPFWRGVCVRRWVKNRTMHYASSAEVIKIPKLTSNFYSLIIAIILLYWSGICYVIYLGMSECVCACA